MASGTKIARLITPKIKEITHCPKVFELMALSVRFLTDGNGLAAG
jgi:hypothetical protein